MTKAMPTRDELARAIAQVAGVSREDIDDTTNLFTLGVDSLSTMRLVNSWRVRGLPVTYHDLAEKPTLDAWWTRISELLRAHPHLAA